MPPNSALPLIPPGTAAPVLLGLSGGLDSTVLLHRLCGEFTQLRAIHVHHGLHPDADAWTDHCRSLCAELDVLLEVIRVDVDRTSGLGVEGAARTARHAAFKVALRDGEILALAHHRDDQAETFLLRALRASGPDGLASMRAWRAYEHGWLWRPLLGTPRADILEYARKHGLRWIDDPSNADTTFDRNFIRNIVMPLLQQRWPQASAAFARSAGLAQRTADHNEGTSSLALMACQRDDGDLDNDALLRFPASLRADVVRAWITQRGLPPLPASGIDAIERQLLPARADAEAEFRWQQARIVRWRDRLHAEPLRSSLDAHFLAEWDGREPLPLPDGTQLELVGARAFDHPLRVRARQGGERIRLPGRDHSHSLKHALQQADVPPWLRERLPVIFDGDEVLAAGHLLSARLQDWLNERHATLRWRHD